VTRAEELDARGRRLRAALAAVLVTALAGCAVYGRVGPLPVGPLPVVPDGTPSAEVTIARGYRFFGRGDPVTIVIDGIPIYHLGTDQFIYFRIPTGHHVIGVRTLYGESSEPLEAQAGQRYWYYVSVPASRVPRILKQ
jgi:hypothetical protein